MKKIIALVLSCLLLFSFSACGAKEDKKSSTNDTENENNIEEENTEETSSSAKKDKSLSSYQAAYLYNKAYTVASEWFDFGNVYFNFDDVLGSDTDRYRYYAIEHEYINSIETLKKYLCQFFSEAFVDSIIEELFIEKDGKLYRSEYIAGDYMPTYYLNSTKAELTSDDKNEYTYDITVKSHYQNYGTDYGNPDHFHTHNIKYVYENGRWVLDNGFSFNLYPSYEWDGKSPVEKNDSVMQETAIIDTSNGNIVTETSENVMMSFVDDDLNPIDYHFKNWANDATVVVFERDYPEDLIFVNDTSKVTPDSNYALDISETFNRGVAAYLTNNGSDVVLHIAGNDGVVMANSISASLFEFRDTDVKIQKIYFNNNFNTSNVTDMQSMFYSCTELRSLDLTGFDTSDVVIMTAMFYNCSSLTSLDVSNFDTSEVVTMAGMFSTCTSLEKLDVSNFDTSSVNNMWYMFFKCSSLKELDLSCFDTSDVYAMNSMFENCESVTKLNLSGFDTSNVEDMSKMFSNCSSLKSLDLSSFSFCDSHSDIFAQCDNLTVRYNNKLYSGANLEDIFN